VFTVYKQVLWFLKARERNFGGTSLQILQTGGWQARICKWTLDCSHSSFLIEELSRIYSVVMISWYAWAMRKTTSCGLIGFTGFLQQWTVLLCLHNWSSWTCQSTVGGRGSQQYNDLHTRCICVEGIAWCFQNSWWFGDGRIHCKSSSWSGLQKFGRLCAAIRHPPDAPVWKVLHGTCRIYGALVMENTLQIKFMKWTS